jgi:hypothetical protein
MSLSSQSFGYALRLVYGADLTSIVQQKTPDNRHARLDFASKAGTLTGDRRDDSKRVQLNVSSAVSYLLGIIQRISRCNSLQRGTR